jgi:uncharacterized membrane protein YeaQ/YmgE (transglycosylase-associated protein family)
MSLRDPILVVHIVAGTAGLILGPIAMTARKRRGRHTRAGGAYHWVMLAVCLSAAAMSLLDWQRIWWFLPIAVFSYANALLGYAAVNLRWRNWLAHHIAGMGGSYIALVTALLVVNVGPSPLIVWFVPSIVGTPLILWIVGRRREDIARMNAVPRGRHPMWLRITGKLERA